MTEIGPRRVVFAPALLLAALFNPEARAHLNEWRDGKIMPVLNRELLLRYLKVLTRAGVSEEQIRQWTLWLTAGKKSLYLPDFRTHAQSTTSVCEEMAELEGAQVIGPQAGYGREFVQVVSAA